MRRSDINVENYQASADWYENNGQIPGFARFGHEVMARLLKPNVTDDPGTKQAIDSLVAKGTGLVLAANHPTKKEPNILAATPAVYEPLAPVMGNTKIMAAAKLFTQPGPKGWLQFRAMTALGAFPVINTELYPGLSEQQYQEMRDIVTRFAQNQLMAGWNLALHPEGDRDRHGEPMIVRPVKPGLEYILGGLPANVHVAVVPIGIVHPDDEPPRVHVGMPRPAESYIDLRPELREQLQAAVGSAAAS